MILQALNSYYENLTKLENCPVPKQGFKEEKVHVAIVLSKEGKLLQIKNLKIKQGAKYHAKLIIVPALTAPRTGLALLPGFLVDNPKYALGWSKEPSGREDDCFNAFKEFNLERTKYMMSDEVLAFRRFLKYWRSSEFHCLTEEDIKNLDKSTVVFQLSGSRSFIHENFECVHAWATYSNQLLAGKSQICLVTGKSDFIPKTHPPIKGCTNAQPTGAALVSFNIDAFCSYGKEQCQNAPIGAKAAFNYTTVLNYLLSYRSRQKLSIANSTILFWGENKSAADSIAYRIFQGLETEPSHTEDATTLKEGRRLLETIRLGGIPSQIEAPDMPFFLLEISPNSARLSVRNWYCSTVAKFIQNFGKHFKELQIEKSQNKDPEFPSMWNLMRSTATRIDMKNLFPLLPGAVLRSILNDSNYPETWLITIISKIRSDGIINYLRAASIKACLIRNYSIQHQLGDLISLNKKINNPAYLLGRLFSVLEKVQLDALGTVNSSIRDKFFSSASVTPALVFPTLLRNAMYHLSKISFGKSADKLIQSILSDLESDGFPKQLPLLEQGKFVLGYYHQKNELFKKKEKK